MYISIGESDCYYEHFDVTISCFNTQKSMLSGYLFILEVSINESDYYEV